MMYRLFSLFIALLSILGSGETLAQEVEFSKESFSFAGTTLPYRKAAIPGYGDKASLVIYLHGGSSKGNDNETQMQEPGIGSIAAWLSANKRKAIMLVPQCPADKTWLGTTLDVIAGLLNTYIDKGVADADKVYIFGGSMGGTGTWNMLSSNPDLFAAAMPVAGNPTGLDAEAVSHTPLFTVMGTADKIMKISNVEAFLMEMDEHSAEYEFNIEGDGLMRMSARRAIPMSVSLGYSNIHEANLLESRQLMLTTTKLSKSSGTLWTDTSWHPSLC